jgi:hypothetical protein
MSRLYIKTRSDVSATGKRADEQMSATMYWGSANDIRFLAGLDVIWVKDSEFPHLVLDVSPHVQLTLSKKGIKP